MKTLSWRSWFASHWRVAYESQLSAVFLDERSEMTYIVSGGALNSTHLLTPGDAAGSVVGQVAGSM